MVSNPGVGLVNGSGVGSGGRSGLGSGSEGTISSGGGAFLSVCAVALRNKNTPASKATSSGGTAPRTRAARSHRRASDRRPGRSRRVPTNSTSLVFSTRPGRAARQRAVEEALPQAGERPGPGLLERRWPVAVDVARAHRLVEQRLGLQRRDDPAAQRLGRTGVARPQVDDLQAAGSVLSASTTKR